MRLRELACEVVVHLRIQVRLRGIDLVDIRVTIYRIVTTGERNYQTDMVLVGEFSHRLDLLRIERTEDDVHILHFRLGEDGVHRSNGRA